MKRSSYFISARSASADLHASELILAIHDNFPKVDSYGILGEWSGRTRSIKLEELSRCLELGLHDKLELQAEAQACVNQLKAQLNLINIDLAVLVGYSYLHHILAGYFKSRAIAVVLYEMTPVGALDQLDRSSINQRIDVALGISPRGSELVQKANISYLYIGSPHKDRTDRVKLNASSIGLKADKPVISLFPGARIEEFQASSAFFLELAKDLGDEAQIVLCIPEHLPETLASILPNKVPQKPIIVSGMNLELLSLSTVAVTGCGAITVESGLFQVPSVAICTSPAPAGGYKALLNQMMGRQVICEMSADAGVQKIAAYVKQLLGPSPLRAKVLADLHVAQADLQGFAAEQAADFIGTNLGRWQKGSSRKALKPYET